MVITLSNAFQPENHREPSSPLDLGRPKISYESALAVSKLPSDVLILLCHELNVPYVASKLFDTVRNITGFDLIEHMKSTDSAEKESLQQYSKPELVALAINLGLATGNL